MIHNSLEERIRAKALILQAQQQLKLAALDFGMQFAPSLHQRTETSIRQLQTSLIEGNEVHWSGFFIYISLCSNSQNVR